MKFLKRVLVPIVHEVVTSQRIRLDVWTPSKVSRQENKRFKAKLIDFYKCDDYSGNIKCMILNEYLPKDIVIGSHIFKASTLGIGLNCFGLKPTDLYNERNGFLLYKNIEKKFDAKELCFIYNPLEMKFVLNVLDPELSNQDVIT
jgi:hypothetical protein